MFAHTVNLNIFYNDHFADIFMKFGRIQYCMGILLVTLCHILHSSCHPFRSFLQSFPFGILSKQDDSFFITFYQGSSCFFIIMFLKVLRLERVARTELNVARSIALGQRRFLSEA